ncbi:MAG: N-6 DNA methylase [Betaproteobacteria bacterium]
MASLLRHLFLVTVNHLTPADLAVHLASLVPSNSRLVLEPCAGKGDLLKPLLNRLSSSATIVCIDKRSSVLDVLRKRLVSVGTQALVIRNGNFLKFTDRDLATNFDCALMNPPFSARKENWLLLDVLDGVPESIKKRSAPIEALFLLKALTHLRAGGTAIAILPGSIVSGISLEWFRRYLLQFSSFEHVHELPKRLFRGVEGRFFVVKMRKATKKKAVMLLNHSFHSPTALTLPSKRDADIRFDFTYASAAIQLANVIKGSQKIKWQRLELLATISRGIASAPFDQLPGLHSDCMQDGFWVPNEETELKNSGRADVLASNRDILVARVSRRASKTFSLLARRGAFSISDCMFRIRPKRQADRNAILAGLRAVYSSDEFGSVLERGTGATYIAKSDLQKVLLPINVLNVERRIAAAYSSALKRRDARKMHELECAMRSKIGIEVPG